MAAPAKVKISDSKIHVFQCKHFFEETCLPNLIQNIILFGLKLFISQSGGSLEAYNVLLPIK